MATILPPELQDLSPHKPAMTDQRRHNRASTLIRSAFKFDGSPARHSEVHNISLGGAWLDMVQNQPDVGSEGKMHAVYGDTHLYMVAKVVRRTPHGIGVSFIDMGMDSYENLKSLLETLTIKEPGNQASN